MQICFPAKRKRDFFLLKIMLRLKNTRKLRSEAGLRHSFDERVLRLKLEQLGAEHDALHPLDFFPFVIHVELLIPQVLLIFGDVFLSREVQVCLGNEIGFDRLLKSLRVFFAHVFNFLHAGLELYLHALNVLSYFFVETPKLSYFLLDRLDVALLTSNKLRASKTPKAARNSLIRIAKSNLPL